VTDEQSGPSEAELRNDAHYDLDAASRLSMVKDAVGNSTVYRYGLGEDAPWPLSVERKEVAGGSTQSLVSILDRDSFGRVVKELRSDGVVTNTTYDQVGNLVDVTSGAGTTVQYDYDGAGKVVRETRPGGRGSTTYGYDLDGRIKVRRTTALGTTWETKYAYDATGRLTSIRRPDGTLEEFTEYYPDDTLKTYVGRQGVKVVSVNTINRQGKRKRSQLQAEKAAAEASKTADKLAEVHELQIVYKSPYANQPQSDVNRRMFDIVADAYLHKEGIPIPKVVLPGMAGLTNAGQLDPYGVAYGGGRADVRLSMDADGEIYLLSKSDGMIRKLTKVVAPPPKR
jgi:YD repeat-containing protein